MAAAFFIEQISCSLEGIATEFSGVTVGLQPASCAAIWLSS